VSVSRSLLDDPVSGLIPVKTGGANGW